mmetsp:Transcript_160881/g.516325  ORF Transcript_160881/g.516325 Transcript_160881/m.516325 type:complete len:233 (+) Transcript_160881:806-1504(+)
MCAGLLHLCALFTTTSCTLRARLLRLERRVLLSQLCVFSEELVLQGQARVLAEQFVEVPPGALIAAAAAAAAAGGLRHAVFVVRLEGRDIDVEGGTLAACACRTRCAAPLRLLLLRVGGWREGAVGIRVAQTCELELDLARAGLLAGLRVVACRPRLLCFAEALVHSGVGLRTAARTAQAIALEGLPVVLTELQERVPDDDRPQVLQGGVLRLGHRCHCRTTPVKKHGRWGR